MWLELFQEIKQRKILLISLLYTLFLVCIALIAPIISPYEVSEQNLSLGASAPSLQHILGTDVLGRDLFSRILYGSRISLLVGFLATFVAITIGLTYGAVSGYFGGKIDSLMSSYFGISSGLILSGTIFAIMFAYVVRFLAVSLQTVESGLEKIKPSMDDAARSLGYRPREALMKVHIPLLKSSSLTALMIVFVDVMKELPATLILRPFDFNTLAVRTFELASDERLADSSTSALAIVLAGLLPVIYLSQTISKTRLK